MMAGVAKALADSEKTMIAPDNTPGMICGRMMRRMIVNEPAPSDKAAFSICGSRRCSAVQTDSTMKGIITCASAMNMPVSVNMKGSGEPIKPSDIRSLLTRPLLPPNRSAQPSVRATTEISNGPRITSRKKLFQRPLMRLRM